MGFFDGYNVAVSGMSAQRTRINVVSANIANAKTTHTENGGPYKKQNVVFEDVLLQQSQKVNNGGICKDIIGFTAEMYASYIKDDDIVKDDKGGISIKKESFIKSIVYKYLTTEQKKRLNYVGKLILTKVAYVLYTSKRIYCI